MSPLTLGQQPQKHDELGARRSDPEVDKLYYDVRWAGWRGGAEEREREREREGERERERGRGRVGRKRREEVKRVGS